MRRSLMLVAARRERRGEEVLCGPDLAAMLSHLLVGLPPFRPEVVAAVRARLVAGNGPSSDALACQILVGAPVGAPG